MKFNSNLMDIVYRNYPKHIARNGDIIIPVDNQLVYTDGAYETIRRFDRRAERGKGKSDAYHSQFVKDRIRNAQEIIRNANREYSLKDSGYTEVVPADSA